MNIKVPAVVTGALATVIDSNAPSLLVVEPYTTVGCATDALELLLAPTLPADAIVLSWDLVRGSHKPEDIMLHVKTNSVKQTNMSILDGTPFPK
jgi:hypothetical protein